MSTATTSKYPSKHPSRRCPVPLCGLPTHGFSSFCQRHADRQYRYGHHAIKAGIRETDLKPFGKWVGPAMANYRNTRGTEAVLKLIDNHVLNYNGAGSIWRPERDLTHIVQEMRYHEVTASDVLSRVCVFQAYAAANLGRFRGSTRAENIALGRMVRRLVPMSRTGRRHPVKAIELLGAELRRLVVPYADRLLQLVQEESAMQHEGVLASLDLKTPATVSADPPRAGGSYRRQRGLQVP